MKERSKISVCSISISWFMHTGARTFYLILERKSVTSQVCTNYRLHLAVCVRHMTLQYIIFIKHNMDIEVMADIWSTQIMTHPVYQYPLSLSSTSPISVLWDIIFMKLSINYVLPRETLCSCDMSKSFHQLFRASNIIYIVVPKT